MAKYQRSLLYITVTLLGILYVGTYYVTIRTYVPFGFLGYLTISEKIGLWNVLFLPSVTITISLWLSNILNSKLSVLSLIVVFLNSSIIVCVPYFYMYHTEKAVISYCVASALFFLIPLSATLIIADFTKQKAAKRPMVGIPYIILLLIQMFLCYAVIYYRLNYISAGRIAIFYIMPLIVLTVNLTAVLNRFYGIYSSQTILKHYLSAALCTLMCALRALGDFAVISLICVMLITFVMSVYEILKFYMEHNKGL